MKKTTFDYLTPECVAVDIVPESVLCISSFKDGSVIEDFEPIPGTWE